MGPVRDFCRVAVSVGEPALTGVSMQMDGLIPARGPTSGERRAQGAADQKDQKCF
ncbi:protein of unknown function [Pararobbsia alpina]